MTEYERPVLLSDNGSCYVIGELKEYLREMNIKAIHGRVAHPQTQGKIERYHRSMKNVVKQDNNFHLEELKESIAEFVDYYNHQSYHESLGNLTPADVYYGRKEEVLMEKERIKMASLKKRRQIFLQRKLLHLNNETLSSN